MVSKKLKVSTNPEEIKKRETPDVREAKA